MSDTLENVLILQGGGSLGAFGCGVFKALANSNIKIDIIAGTSIGGLNASIIAGSRTEEGHPEKALEQFWLELAEGSTSKNNVNFNPPFIGSSPGIESPMSTTTTTTTDSSAASSSDRSSITHASQLKSLISFYNGAIYGNKKVFMPRWRPEHAPTDPEYFAPHKWTYLYDHSPLIKTLEKYVDYNRLQIKGLYYISRDEPFPDLYENADFSIDTIKAAIRAGELKTKQILKGLLQSM
ncbi:MAG: patatin-like phospholipase family protein, partial [Nitrososphaeraceae archaeon]